MALCTAHKTDGTACKAHAIAGGTVCRTHGGGCPQVIRAAKLRLALASDVVAKRLVTIATGKRTKTSDAIMACKDILDRAGVRHDRGETAAGSGEGTVLWEEFIAIHRLRATDAKTSAIE